MNAHFENECTFWNCPKVWTFWEAHKNLRNLPHALYIYLVNVQTVRKIFSNFVCFSESPNFNKRTIFSKCPTVIVTSVDKKHRLSSILAWMQICTQIFNICPLSSYDNLWTPNSRLHTSYISSSCIQAIVHTHKNWIEIKK